MGYEEQVRRALALNTYERVSFGPPDRSGWCDVAVTDSTGGGKRNVGQIRANVFRPAPDITFYPPAVQSAHSHAPHDPSPVSTAPPGDPRVGLLMVPAALVVGYTVFAWGRGAMALFGMSRGTMLSLMAIALLGLWSWGVLALFRDPPGQQATTHLASTEEELVIAPPRALPRLSALPPVNCPSCGAPVTGATCAYCGWARARLGSR